MIGDDVALDHRTHHDVDDIPGIRLRDELGGDRLGDGLSVEQVGERAGEWPPASEVELHDAVYIITQRVLIRIEPIEHGRHGNQRRRTLGARRGADGVVEECAQNAGTLSHHVIGHRRAALLERLPDLVPMLPLRFELLRTPRFGRGALACLLGPACFALVRDRAKCFRGAERQL
jgi:hypothetical protein